MAIDFYRPVGMIGWFLAGDLGRAAFHLLTRGVAPTLVGVVAVRHRATRRPPVHAVAFVVSLPLALTGQLRDPLPGRGQRVLDPRRPGLQVLAGAFAIFFSGMTLPLVLFPGWFGTLAEALPWAALHPGPDRHLARHGTTGSGCSVRSASRPLDGGPAGLLPARAARGRPARWWSRVAEPLVLSRGYVDIASLWVRAAWVYRDVVHHPRRRQRPDHRPGRRGHLDHFRAPRPAGRLRAPRGRLLYGASSLGLGDRGHPHRQRRAGRRDDPDRPARPDADQAAAAAAPGLRGPVHAAAAGPDHPGDGRLRAGPRPSSTGRRRASAWRR